ncbi:potassium-transporting ATPase subunit KdpC [Pseudoxanthomonas sp. SE1]|uniref:potassium-transporting ATPase subunit KdpC n=1 Tax=Pseudoxanthomonas sp. SE1 TaxID=1664560 RepID=UPI00240D3F4E|nr:potassium-transporting ATPase subunit KdpC [Pseudoxanthomonas sp. SE1]WFC42494.1 potassium-transporting ATPase subunit KdpC [Pseudoxanthomonas sp. SE1]
MNASRPVSTRGPLRPSLMLAAVSLLGFGLLYSLAGTGLGRALFPHQATGSLIERDGQVIGSSLVAQPFADDRYFQSRPSAASYDVMALAGSNQARTNPDLRSRIDEARAAVAAREGVAPDAVPGDLVTQSGGGIDPHLSPTAIRIQIARVARARGIEAADVERLVAAHTEAPQFGVLGAPRVNVLQLNLALDAEM